MSTNLFDVFVGEFVTIMTDIQVKVSQENQQGSMQKQGPIYFDGFLLDVDDEYVYLGDKADSINRAIKTVNIVHINIAKKEDAAQDMLDKLESPAASTKFN